MKRFPILRGSSGDRHCSAQDPFFKRYFWQRVHLFLDDFHSSRRSAVGGREKAADRTSPRRPLHLPRQRKMKSPPPHSWRVRPHIGFFITQVRIEFGFPFFLFLFKFGAALWFFKAFLGFSFCVCQKRRGSNRFLPFSYRTVVMFFKAKVFFHVVFSLGGVFDLWRWSRRKRRVGVERKGRGQQRNKKKKKGMKDNKCRQRYVYSQLWQQ